MNSRSVVNRLFTRVVSCVCLLVMVTFLASKAYHTYTHHHHHHSESCSSTSHDDSHSKTDHKCNICDFVLSSFVSVDKLVVKSSITLLTLITCLYIVKEPSVFISGKNSRAPPRVNLI